jgi:hypothetical protein
VQAVRIAHEQQEVGNQEGNGQNVLKELLGACEALEYITGRQVCSIQSLCELYLNASGVRYSLILVLGHK